MALLDHNVAHKAAGLGSARPPGLGYAYLMTIVAV
jgi:hypothetical protein